MLAQQPVRVFGHYGDRTVPSALTKTVGRAQNLRLSELLGPIVRPRRALSVSLVETENTSKSGASLSSTDIREDNRREKAERALPRGAPVPTPIELAPRMRHFSNSRGLRGRVARRLIRVSGQSGTRAPEPGAEGIALRHRVGPDRLKLRSDAAPWGASHDDSVRRDITRSSFWCRDGSVLRYEHSRRHRHAPKYPTQGA